MNQLPLGTYRHFKGNVYKVIGTVKHSETEELMVLYHPMYGSESDQSQLWVRPYEMFTGLKKVNSEFIKRFKLISEN